MVFRRTVHTLRSQRLQSIAICSVGGRRVGLHGVFICLLASSFLHDCIYGSEGMKGWTSPRPTSPGFLLAASCWCTVHAMTRREITVSVPPRRFGSCRMNTSQRGRDPSHLHAKPTWNTQDRTGVWRHQHRENGRPWQVRTQNSSWCIFLLIILP